MVALSCVCNRVVNASVRLSATEEAIALCVHRHCQPQVLHVWRDTANLITTALDPVKQRRQAANLALFYGCCVCVQLTVRRCPRAWATSSQFGM